jgi:hypothetical protein
MYGYGAGAHHAPVYQQQYAQPLYAQTTNEYLGPAKVLNWTPTERELLDRTLPVEGEMELASVVRGRSIYDGMNEYEREDWDTDLWAQQLFRYDLDDQRDRLERELTYAQDKKRAELDEVWEFYKKKTQYKYDQPEPETTGYGDYYKPKGAEVDAYDNYDKLDVRESMLRANQLWDDEVLATRQAWRETLEAERQAHRDAVAEIVARREAEIAGLKQAVIDRRLVKRAEVQAANDALDAAIRQLITDANMEVAALNDTHQELVLQVLEAVDYYGEEADIKLILTQAGEGNIDLYGEQDVHGLWTEDRVAEWKPTKYTSKSYGRRHAYTRPAYDYGY